MPKKYKSYAAAVFAVRKLFTGASKENLSLDEVFSKWGRDLSKTAKNRTWFSNKLMELKHHNLVVPVYSFGSGPRRLVKIELTPQGKKELGRKADDEVTEPTLNKSVSLADVMEKVAQLKAQFSEYEISFDVKLKETE